MSNHSFRARVRQRQQQTGQPYQLVHQHVSMVKWFLDRFERPEVSTPYESREGGFILAPNAVVDDGWFDYLHAGPLRRWELIRYFPRMISGRIPTDHPKLWMGRCRQVTIQSEAPLVAHTDGEFFCRPEEGILRLDIRILPRALSVQTTSSARKEKA